MYKLTKKKDFKKVVKTRNKFIKMNWFYCGLFLTVLLGLSSAANKLQERYNWQQLDWVFPNQQIKDRAIASGDYIPTNGLPVGIERWQNKLFVSVPRWKNGKKN